MTANDLQETLYPFMAGYRLPRKLICGNMSYPKGTEVILRGSTDANSVYVYPDGIDGPYVVAAIRELV